MTDEEYDRIVTEERHADRVAALEAEVERLNSPVLKSDWQKMEAELARLRNRVSLEDHEAVLAALAALRDENAAMINAAGCALGTDEALRSSACVEVLARQTEALRGELAVLREQRCETCRYYATSRGVEYPSAHATSWRTCAVWAIQGATAIPDTVMGCGSWARREP